METTAVTWDVLSPIVEAVTSTFSVTSVLGVFAGVLGAGMGFVFLWWGGRKAYKFIMSTAKGKAGKA